MLKFLAVNNDNKVAIAKAGVIPPLVALIRKGRYDTKQIALGALKNLAVNNDNKVAIAATGAIPLLVALIRKGRYDTTKEAAAEVLKNLSYF